jgi:ElaB/YqjD/DUF883 family membrane-anchored ribosome-binding protein
MATATQTPSTELMNRSNGPGQDFKSKIQVAEKQFEKMSHDAGAKVGAMATNLADSANEYVETGRDYVKHNPGRSVAIAAATGLVVGSLITLAMRRK